MIDIGNVPAPPVPAARATADKQLLRGLAVAAHLPPAPARGRWTVVAAVTAAALTGATAAAAYSALTPEPATVSDSARCYSTVSSDTGDGFPGTTVSVAAPAGELRPSTPDAALATCADLWQRGFLTAAGFQAPDVPNGPDGLPPASHPLPQLTACVLPGGQAAVYPGTDAVCAELGLPLLAPSA